MAENPDESRWLSATAKAAIHAFTTRLTPVTQNNPPNQSPTSRIVAQT
jgi:hypothetical protein